MLLLLPMSGAAQQRLPNDPSGPPILDPRHRLIASHEQAVVLEGGFDFNSNALFNELPLALWRGAYLDRQLRGRSRDALHVRNSLGYALEARLTYHGKGEGRWRPLMSLAHHEHLGVRFAADLYNLTFFGNAGYELRRADLGPARFLRTRYQTFGFGAWDTRGTSFIRIELVMGQSLDAANIRWADLYTGADGRVLRSRVNGEYLRSDTASSKAGTLNGLGLAVSGRWDMPISRHRNGMRLEVEVQDLGFCGWNRTTQRLSRDTTLVFEGITVDNILDLDQAVIGEEALLDTLGVRFVDTGITTVLPFTISLRLSSALGERWKGAILLDQRNAPGYVPQLSFIGARSFGDRTEVSLTLSMGGFGGLRLGAGLSHAVKKNLLLMIGSTHLPAFATGLTRGAGLQVMATYAF